MLLGYIVAKVPASPRNSTWFTRPFLLVRGWGLGTRLLFLSGRGESLGMRLVDSNCSEQVCSGNNMHMLSSFQWLPMAVNGVCRYFSGELPSLRVR